MTGIQRRRRPSGLHLDVPDGTLAAKVSPEHQHPIHSFGRLPEQSDAI
jgi:hypothetical protein